MEQNNRRINGAKRRKLIATYKLPCACESGSSSDESGAGEDDDECNGAVVNNSILSFVAGMTRLNKEYTRKSYLLASSYVSDVLNIARGTQAWYDEFIKVLASLGWLPLRSSFERLSTRGKGLTMQSAALGIIAATVASTALSGPLTAALPKLAADSLEALKRHPDSFDLFSRNITTHQGGDFGLASCSEVDGEVLMVLVTYSAQGISKQVGLPFIEWDSSLFDVFSGQTCLVLDASVVNEETIKLLGKSAGEKVLKAIAHYQI